MAKHGVALLALTGCLLAACDSGGEPQGAGSEEGRQTQGFSEAASSGDWLDARSRTSPARWLAEREAGGASSGAVAEGFDRLLQRAAKQFQEEPRMIANRAVQLQGMLASNGLNEGAGAIIEAFSGAVPEGRRHGFGEMCQHYYNLRAAGVNREDALTALRRDRDGRDH